MGKLKKWCLLSFGKNDFQTQHSIYPNYPSDLLSDSSAVETNTYNNKIFSVNSFVYASLSSAATVALWISFMAVIGDSYFLRPSNDFSLMYVINLSMLGPYHGREPLVSRDSVFFTAISACIMHFFISSFFLPSFYLWHMEISRYNLSSIHSWFQMRSYAFPTNSAVCKTLYGLVSGK